MDAESSFPLQTVAEIVVWAVPSLVAFLLALRVPSGERRPWLFIASVCAVFALDEVLDILGRAHHLAQSVARSIDPGNSFRGDTLIWRIVLLALGAGVGLALMLYLFRGKGSGGVPRWVAFAGVCLVLFYVVFRLMPGLGQLTAGPVGWGIQGVAWCLLIGGSVMEFDRLRDR